MKQRAISIVVHQSLADESQGFNLQVAAALRAYADAIVDWESPVGRSSLEFFTAPNGCNVIVIAGASSWRQETGIVSTK